MRCTRCAAPLDATGVFPGGSITCVCGAANVVAGDRAMAESPFRIAEVPIEPAASPSLDPGQGACPRCARPLHEVLSREETVGACLSCGGAFVDHAALSSLVSAAIADAAHADAANRPPRRSPIEREVHYLACPSCLQIMQRMNFGKRSGIMVDACKLHGTWFDAGELEDVLGFVARGGLHDVPIPHAEDDAATSVTTHDEPPLRDVTDLLGDLLRILTR